MSSTPKRRPSTLAATKFVAAQRPLGATPDPREASRSEPAPKTGAGRSLATANMTTSARAAAARPSPLIPGASAFSMPSASFRSAGGAATSAATTAATASAPPRPTSRGARDARAANARPGVAGAARERQDNILVTSLIVAFVLLTLGIGSVRVRGGMTVERSKSAITATLATVHQQQSTFRTLNQRYATWNELEDRGMKLGPRQVVVASNATSYHWFLSVRDSSTGVICSRTGELFDDSANDRRAACVDRGP